MRFCAIALFGLITLTTYAQQRGDILSYTLVQTLTADSFDAEVEAYTGFPGEVLGLEYDFNVYEVQYYTLDYRPDSLTIATGLVTLPIAYPCASGIFTFGHGFCLKDQDAPSNPSSIYGMIIKGVASNGFVGVAPDYIHLGSNASPGFQAFMNAKTEATSTIDLIRAAKTICQNEGVSFTDQLFLTGYSQGGHSSFATAREIQLYHAGEFTVTAVCPGGGTFDLAGVAADSLLSNTRKTPEPHAMCMIVRSYSEVYRDSLFNLGLPNDPVLAFDSIFKSPYDSLLLKILDRNDPFAAVNLLDSIPIRMVTDTFRNQLQNDPNHYFRTLLSYNSLYDWTPQMPVNFVHSPVDIENPMSNVQRVMQLFEDSGATDIQLSIIPGNLSHVSAGLPYVLFAIEYMRTKRVDCLTGIEQTDALALDWEVYPNPAANELNIRWQKTALSVEVNLYTASGEVIANTIAPNTVQAKTIPLTALPAGNYVVEVKAGANSYYKVVVKL